MEQWLITSPWPGIILWTLIYISDYRMTILNSRKYKTNPIIEFEGSFELTPQFQNDVDTLKPVSKRHILLLLVTNAMLFFFWWSLSAINFRQGFSFLLGMFILMEVAVHLRHFRTNHLLNQVAKRGGLEGKLLQRRWLTYSTSSFEFLCFSLLFLFTAALTGSLFFLGGGIECLAVAFNHYRKYRGLLKQASAAPEFRAEV